jgi:hypothetical protein
MDEVTTTPAAPETVTIDGATYYSASRVSDQYKVGLDHGMNIAKNKARNSIIDVMRDTVAMGGMDLEDAQSLLTALLTACDMEDAKLLLKWNVYATLNGSDFYQFEGVEAETDEDAIEKVKESFHINDITLTATFSWDGGYGDEASVYGFDYDIEDNLDWSAEEA